MSDMSIYPGNEAHRKSEQVTRIVHEMENAVYYGLNLRLCLINEDVATLDTLEKLLAKFEMMRPGKDKNKHI